MRLTSVQVHNYNSFNQSPVTPLNENISIILGKNESGKTSFLRALASFDVSHEYSVEEVCTYSPNKKALDQERVSPDDLPIVTMTFSLEPSDVDLFKEIHESLANVREFTVTKFFSGRLLIGGPDYDIAKNSLNAEISDLAAALRVQAAEFITSLKQDSKFQDPLKPLEAFATSFNPLKLNVEQLEKIISTQLDALQSVSFEADSEAARTSLANRLQSAQPKLADLLARRAARPTKILGAIPRFIYFSSVDELEDGVTITELKANQKEYKTLRNLLQLVNLELDSLAKADLYDRKRMTKGASTFVTGLVNESWRQEEVQVSLSVDGDNLLVSVEDETGAIDPPSRRSEGFRYFLAFYINFGVGSRGELKNTVLLLDDPGVYLHADGQKDLLATLEKLSTTNQIVVATHSPFLVDPHKMERILIAEKRAAGVGSSITRDFHKSAFDALQAVRAAVGMTLGNSLFFNKTNFLLEGPGDRWIFEAFAKACHKANLTEFHLDKAAFVGVGGAGKMAYFVHLFLIEGLPITCILDNDPAGHKAKQELVRDVGVDDARVRTLDQLCTRTGDYETEDLIDEDFYLGAVNRTYASVSSAEREFPQITLGSLAAYDGLRTKKYQRYFRDNGLGNFDKEAVAREIYSSVVADDFDLATCPQALKSFQAIFEQLRGTLKV